MSRSSICSGPTAIYIGIDGSTLLFAKVLRASTNLAIVRPAAGEPTPMLLELLVEVEPVFPVDAVPSAASMMASSTARPIAYAAAWA